MKTGENILVAFLLNISFSIFELLGGVYTNSVAIISDAIHDFGDAISIGISYILEKKSKKKPDEKYTYGYSRYSVLGATITNTILIIGSILVIFKAIEKIINPVNINYDGMIIFAIIGVIVNFFAAYFTRHGDSLNQKAVNLHMLEDILGWAVVLIGAIIIKFSKITLIDPIMSIGVALFILSHAINGFKEIINIFLEKTPDDIKIDELKKHLLNINGIMDVHHIHIWSIDGYNNFATMHVVTKVKDTKNLKHEIKEELKEHGISHTTIEIEEPSDKCEETECIINTENSDKHHHHHHHH